MFRNKHVVIAMIVAPILAVIAYFATDQLAGEKPHKAEAGQSYALVALPNCRYASGHCTLKNAAFKIDLTVDQVGVNVLTLSLNSAFPLQGAKAALVADETQQGSPASLTASDDTGMNWTIDLSGDATDSSLLRIVVAASDAFYFGETGLAFMNYQTSFGEDFRH